MLVCGASGYKENAKGDLNSCDRNDEFQGPVPWQLTAAGFVCRNTVVPRMEKVICVRVADVDLFNTVIFPARV